MAAFVETSTGVWQVTFTPREKQVLEVIRATEPQSFKRLVEGFLLEKEEQVAKSKAKLLAQAYRNANPGLKRQIDRILGL